MTLPEPFGARLKHAWNAFRNRDPTESFMQYGYGSYQRQDKIRSFITSERSIIISVLNRMAIDVSSISIRHIRMDDNNERFKENISSGLNYCLTAEANIDQTGRAFIQDIVVSMFDEGVVAVVPIDTTINPKISGSYEIQTMRTGRIVAWYPEHIRVRVYNDRTGLQEEITLPKKTVAIIENPFYSVMNEPNSTLKRLIRKLALLDAIDEQSGSGKLDVIIQLPYMIKSEMRKKQAEDRRANLEEQLAGSKYGVAYTDATERITQLNRPAENNLMAQIEYLHTKLYSELGVTEEVFKGTADEATMLNYTNRTLIPILNAVVDEFNRKFLTKTARTQNQTIMYFKEPFNLVPVSELANIADRFTRNEILSSNEVRAIIGYKPVDTEEADELRNKNINRGAMGMASGIDSSASQSGLTSDQAISLFEGLLDGLEGDIDSIIGGGDSEG